MVHLVGAGHSSIHSFSKHLSDPQGLAVWRDRDKQAVVSQSRLMGLWEHEGRCLTHPEKGTGQAENGRNIVAKQTELQNMLRNVQKWERLKPTGLRVIALRVRMWPRC